MNVYIICPVRPGISKRATAYAKKLEDEGHTVFYPPRDVNQGDPVGLSICTSERSAIERADEVHVFYMCRSQGTHFDLGMAFALRKPIKIIAVLEASSADYKATGKTYLRAMRLYSKAQK